MTPDEPSPGEPGPGQASRTVSRIMWFFAIVYVVEGIGQAKSGVIWQPLAYFLKQTQGWDAVKISVSLAVLDLPWIIKPLYGAFSDFVPLFGYRRRYYLILANAVAVLAFGWVAMISSPAALVPALTVTAFAMAISSTLCGALLVEAGQKHDASANFINQQWLWYNIAQMVAVLLAGYLIEILSPVQALHTAAWIAAVAPISIIANIWLIEEPRARLDLPALRQRLAALVSAFRTRNLWLVAGFLFLYYFSPGFGTPLYFQMSDRLGFSQGFIGVLASISAFGWILGGLLYRWKLRVVGKRTLLRLSILFGVVTTLSYLALVGPVTAVMIWLLSGVAGMIATIATLSLAADSCPEGAEGFAFAGMMSIINLTNPLSDTLGSVLYQHVFNEQLAPLIVVSATATALVFFLIPLMLFRKPEMPR
jgi:MFS family permease